MNNQPLNIILGKQYICLSSCLDGLLEIPISSIATPIFADEKYVKFYFTEPDGKIYDGSTRGENFLHMFKPAIVVGVNTQEEIPVVYFEGE